MNQVWIIYVGASSIYNSIHLPVTMCMEADVCSLKEICNPHHFSEKTKNTTANTQLESIYQLGNYQSYLNTYGKRINYI